MVTLFKYIIIIWPTGSTFQMTNIYVVLGLALLTVAVIAEDFELEYYKNVAMECDETQHNFSSTVAIEEKHWMIPNGQLILVNSSDFHFVIDNNFTLFIDRIDDDDFGIYRCLIVRSDFNIDVIEHTLNIDGPYFGDLLSKYRHNAMIGGIAAGSLFVVLAGSCIIWQLRYHKRDERNKAVDVLDKTIDGYDLKAYDNVAIESDNKNAANGVTELDETM